MQETLTTISTPALALGLLRPFGVAQGEALGGIQKREKESIASRRKAPAAGEITSGATATGIFRKSLKGTADFLG